MSEIIPLFHQSQYRYTVYEHKIVSRNELSVARLIVIKNNEHRIVYYTGLEAFSDNYTGQLPKIRVRKKAELAYICMALNYMIDRWKLKRISDTTADMIFDFFDYYVHSPKGKSDELMRSQQSMEKCIRAVSHFYANLAAIYDMQFEPSDLLNYEYVRASKESKKEVKRYVPRYVPQRQHSYDTSLLRDMPLAAAARLVELAYEHDPMIAFAIVLQLGAGLRPGSICNLRQNDSPISPMPCIRMSYIGSSVSGIKIDLTHEYLLRSDGVRVGGIKKERTVDVCKLYIPEIVGAYRRHMKLLSTLPCEDYRPMFLGRNGKALTYSAYAERVKRLVYGPLRKECKLSSDPLVSAFGHHLDSMSWGPHTLRHCFTVRLVLDGYQVADIQKYRGDKSPDSALHYMALKGELMMQVTAAHRDAIEGLSDLYRHM